MPQVASILTRSLQGEELPAAIDRLSNAVFAWQGVLGLTDGSFKVTQDSGSNMKVKVGSGSPFDRCVVRSGVPGGGTYILEHQDATVTLDVEASDSTNDRIDIVVARVYDDIFDSSGEYYSDIEIITGTPAGSPSAPATPPGALKLAEILVAASSTAVTDGDIDDWRGSETQGMDAPVRGAFMGSVIYNTPGTHTFVKANYPGLRAVMVEMVGGGAAGETTGYEGGASAGRGGGGGEYARSFLLASALGPSETVTVGAGGEPNPNPGAGGSGGQSSFGSLVIANGGQGADSGAVGGLGGTGGTGDLLIPGQRGEPGFQTGREWSGTGGDSYFGHGGTGRRGNFNSDAEAGAGYGSGGGGATSNAGTVRSGGAGAPGIVIVTLYY